MIGKDDSGKHATIGRQNRWFDNRDFSEATEKVKENEIDVSIACKSSFFLIPTHFFSNMFPKPSHKQSIGFSMLRQCPELGTGRIHEKECETNSTIFTKRVTKDV